MNVVLKKLSMAIQGYITYHGKPIGNADVKLINNQTGRTEYEVGSFDVGFYSIPTDALPKGNYTLKVDYKSSKHVTLRNWLVMKKNIQIQIPLNGVQTNKFGYKVKIINIALISQADKMGYTGP